MRTAMLLTPVLTALLLAGCSREPDRSPKAVNAVIKLGVAAQQAGNLEEAEERYLEAFELVDAVGNDSQAVFTADLAADVALARKAPDRALKLYERIAERYPDSVRRRAGVFRIPNNLGVLLAQDGRLDEGIAIVAETLEMFEGTQVSPGYPFGVRSTLARNLFAMHGKHAWNSSSESALQETLAWLEPAVQQHTTSPEVMRGGALLLEALGDFASKGPRPEEAKRLYALAHEAAERGQGLPSRRSIDGTPCAPRVIQGLTVETCYAMLE